MRELSEDLKLALGELGDRRLIAIVDSSGVVTRELPPSKALRPEALARRLAEIELAVDTLGEELPDGLPAPALTEAEQAVLARGGFSTAAATPEDATPLQRATVEYALLVRNSFTVEEAAKKLGVNASRVRQRLTEDPPTLYALKVGREWRIPKFQFGRKGLIPNLERVIAELPRDLNPVAVHRWFRAKHPDLVAPDGEATLSPLDWLRSGGAPEAVAALAAQL